MKLFALVVFCSVLAAFVVLVGCEPDNLVAETESCMECHSGDSTEGNVVLAAQAQYEESGHYRGPRTLDPNYLSTGHTYVFHGSNAMYTNGSGCANCHTHQGFVDFVAAGMPSGNWNQSYGAASQPGCFTCHKPHVAGNFSLRKESSETLVDGTTVFDEGAGNLCVTCHKARTVADDFLTGDPVSWRSSSGPHHGPQADFITGTNHWVYGSNTYVGASVHLDPRAPDSCASCHLYEPAARLGGSLELGGHGMYLTGAVHGDVKDVVGVCRTCHTTGWPDTNLTGDFASNTGQTTTANWDGDGNASEAILDEIEGMRDTLIRYFGDGTNNFSGDGTGPIVAISDGGDITSGEWNLDWEFNPTTTDYSLVVSRSLWNFKYFMEDRSGGIHNPTYAAQILYDAIDNLNDNAAAGLFLGATRPN